MESRKMKRQLSAACHYSYTRLVLNYYMYYETSLENTLLDNRLAPQNARYNRLLRGFLEGKYDIEALDELRNQVTSVVETATAYTDAFTAYEYVINRLEGRFAPQLIGEEKLSHEAAMTLRIMSYIMENNDSMTVNERIRSVLGQLPVRFTKQKFFALVERGLSVYRGGTRESLDSMLYILRSEALLNQPEDMVTGFEEIHSILEEFKKTDYKQMTQECCRHLSDEITRAGRLLVDNTSELMLLTELINDLYVLFLTRENVLMEVSEEQRLKGILGDVLALFEKGEGEMIPQAVTGRLTMLEGRQEAYYEQFLSGLAAEGPADGKKLSGEEVILLKVERLLSGSPYVSLEASGPDAAAVVDETMLKKELERFCEEFTRAYEGQPKVLVRAVMAKSLSCLPVFFESMEEVQEYIKSSLINCPDYMEKFITMKLMNDMMNEDGFGWDR